MIWADKDEDASDDIPLSFALIREAIEDCKAFITNNSSLIAQSGLSPESIGHDIWLTRKGHGAGFWDRGLGDIGEKLTQACRDLGDTSLYVGDDGKYYTG